MKQRHLDQIIDDVGSGCVGGNGQTPSDYVELIDDETNTVTPVSSRDVQQSISSIIPGNGNGGNVTVLPKNVLSVEVHASDDCGLPSESHQSRNVLNSCEVGQGSVPIQMANTGGLNMTEASQTNEVGQGHVLRQRSTITVDDLENALKTLTGKSFSEITNLNLPSIDMAIGTSHGDRGVSMTSPSIVRSVGVSNSVEQPGTRPSSQQDDNRSEAVAINHVQNG